MRRYSFRLVSALLVSGCAAASLAACAPSPIPAGYTYHRDTYKSPPAPKAGDIGYDFTVQANAKAVDAWRAIGQDLLSRLESGNALSGHNVAIVPALISDHHNNSLYYALDDVFAAHGYKLESYSPDVPALAFKIVPLEGAAKKAQQEALNAYAQSHGFDPKDVTSVSLHLQVYEGNKAVYETAEAYTIPAFGYGPEINQPPGVYRREAVGRAPFWVAPNLRPTTTGPSITTTPSPTMPPLKNDRMAGDRAVNPDSNGPAITKSDLSAPETQDEANKPLDLQRFNN